MTHVVRKPLAKQPAIKMDMYTLKIEWTTGFKVTILLINKKINGK